MLTPEAVSQIPVSSWFVPSCCERILNKKVAQVALNLLEKIVDWVLSWIYCPYQYLFQAKLARVHLFADETPLVDCTKEGIVSIVNGQIAISGRQVQFTIGMSDALPFSKATRTEYVIVQEAPEEAHEMQILAQEMAYSDGTRPREKMWRINLTKIHLVARASFYLATSQSLNSSMIC